MTYYTFLTVTPEKREKLLAVALKVHNLLTKQEDLSWEESYFVLDNLLESLKNCMGLEGVEKVEHSPDTSPMKSN